MLSQYAEKFRPGHAADFSPPWTGISFPVDTISQRQPAPSPERTLLERLWVDRSEVVRDSNRTPQDVKTKGFWGRFRGILRQFPFMVPHHWGMSESASVRGTSFLVVLDNSARILHWPFIPRQMRLDAPGTLHYVMGRGIEAGKGDLEA